MSGALNCAGPDLRLVAAAGFVMGLQHATDADHVVAVSTIVTKSRRTTSAWLIGAAWGVGHTATLLAAGTAVLALQSAIPVSLADGLERAVGMMLVLLGALSLAGKGGHVYEHEHPHSHADDGHGSHGHHLGGPDPGLGGPDPGLGGPDPSHSAPGEHAHPHVHVPAIDALARGERPRLGRSFAVGMVHGLAGSSAISLALLAAMPTALAGAAYLLVFGLGTLAGMAALSALFAKMIVRAASVRGLDRWLAPSVGVASVAFGLVIVFGGAP